MRRFLVILIVVSACHGKRAGKDFFGTRVSPPGVLAQIRPGMTLAEVKAIAPDAKDDPGKGLLLGKPASNVKLYAIMDGDLVQYTYADYDGEDGMAVLTAAWGPPDKEPDRGDLHNTAWRSTATGWRASVFCGNGTKEIKLPPFCTIEFRPHLPLENMFGKEVAPPGALAKVTPRMTLAQLKATTHLAALTDKPTQTALRWLDYDGAVEHIGVVDGRLYSLDYTVPESARSAIGKAWGQPTVEGEHSIWFDAKSGWSAMLEKSGSDSHELRLEFVGYQPLAAQLDLFENLSKSATVADAQEAHRELDWSATMNNVPSFWAANTEFTDPAYRVTKMNGVGLFPAKGGVRLVTLQLDAKRESELVEVLTKRWGPPVKKTTAADHYEYRFPNHATLEHIGAGDPLALQVGPET